MPASTSNFWVFLLDLHGRALLVAVFVATLCKLPGWLELKAQCLPYKEGFPESLSRIERLTARLFGISLTPRSTGQSYERHDEKIRSGLISWFRDAIYHPWARLTSHNQNRELLMVDVLTKEGSIYSGWVTGWVPSKDSLSAIPIEHALRFFPKKSESESRRIEFIKNNGELVIPMQEIVTLHFWEIRKQFETRIVVRKSRDIERVKWMLVLAHVFPMFFSKIEIHIFLTETANVQFAEELASWLEDSKIVIGEDIIDFVVDDTRPVEDATKDAGPKEPQKPKPLS